MDAMIVITQSIGILSVGLPVVALGRAAILRGRRFARYGFASHLGRGPGWSFEPHAEHPGDVDMCAPESCVHDLSRMAPIWADLRRRQAPS